MKCTVDYKSDEVVNILTRTFKGDVTMTDVISSWEYIINNRLITQTHKGVISDYSEACIQSDIEDIAKLKNLVIENIDIFQNLKLAVIINSPKIIIPMLFQYECSNIDTKPFSTIDAAIDWINEINTKNTHTHNYESLSR